MPHPLRQWATVLALTLSLLFVGAIAFGLIV